MADQQLCTPKTVTAPDKPSNMEATISRIESKLDQLISWQKDVVSEIHRIQTTMEELRNTTETLMDEQQQLRTDNYELRRLLEWNEIEIDKLKQEKLQKAFQISNIPVQDGENLIDITIQVCREVGVTLVKEEVQEIFRVRSYQTLKSQIPPPILVKVINKSKRDEILAKKQEEMELTTAKLNMVGEKTQDVNIYINEVLTKRNRYLFKMARDLKRNGKIRYVWFKDGRLLVRKSEKGKVKEITSSAALNEFSK